jgi:hypothetical protein
MDKNKLSHGIFNEDLKDLLTKVVKEWNLKTPFDGNLLTRDLYNELMNYCGSEKSEVMVKPEDKVVKSDETKPIVQPKEKENPDSSVSDDAILERLKNTGNLRYTRKDKIVKWRGPELTEKEFNVLNDWLSSGGWSYKKKSSMGDIDDDGDVDYKYKWKKRND